LTGLRKQVDCHDEGVRQRKAIEKAEEGANVSEVYLFGSRVYGTPLEESDLDMIVVSDEFKKRSFIENTILLSTLWDGSFILEMFPYIPEQIRMFYGRKVTVTEALDKGIRIKL